MRFPSGQPEWQNGTPHSMQRAPCSRSSGTVRPSWNSLKSWTRSPIGRLRPSTRLILRNPPSSPMRGLRAVLAGARGGGPARAVGARLVRPLGLALGGLGDVLLLAGVDGLAVARARAGRGGRAVALAHRAVRRLDPAERRVALLGVEHRRPLRRLGERALVVARHHLAPRAAQRLPLTQNALGDGAPGALAVLLNERTDLGQVVGGRILEVDEAAVEVRGELALGVEHVGDPAAHAGGEVAPGRAEHDHAAAGHVLAAVVTRALDDRAGARVAHREALAGEPAEERAPARRPV